MGREIKRVPIDFDWPQDKVWAGFIAPVGMTDDGWDEWTRTEPPEGEGWQVWETVSEGSPVTPVFSTPEGLAKHMSTVGVWGRVYDYDTALRFIGQGSAPSMVVDSHGLRDGVEFAGSVDA